MTSTTENQNELAIIIGDEDTKKEEKEENNSNNNVSGPKCSCGELMEKTKALDTDHECSGCEFSFDSTDEYYWCPKGTDCPKNTTRYCLCLNCAKFVQNCNDEPVNDIHDREKLYYIYNDDKIQGAMTINDIITLYVTKKIKTTEMYVMAAKPDDTWTKLEFPENMISYDTLEADDKKRCDKMEECEKINSKIKEKYP
eukprot:482528_1